MNIPTYLNTYKYVTVDIRFYYLNGKFYISLKDYLVKQATLQQHIGITDDALIDLELVCADKNLPGNNFANWLAETKNELLALGMESFRRDKEILTVMNEGKSGPLFTSVNAESVKKFANKNQMISYSNVTSPLELLQFRVLKGTGVVIVGNKNIVFAPGIWDDVPELYCSAIAAKYVKNIYCDSGDLVRHEFFIKSSDDKIALVRDQLTLFKKIAPLIVKKIFDAIPTSSMHKIDEHFDECLMQTDYLDINKHQFGTMHTTIYHELFAGNYINGKQLPYM